MGNARRIVPVRKDYDMQGGSDIKTKFSTDLKFGKDNERLISDIIEGGQSIEVKTERDIWLKTGNFVLELFRISRGGKRESSGLSISKSQHWVQSFNYEGTHVGFFCLPTATLRNFARYVIEKKYVKKITPMGDGFRTYGILIPIGKFWSWWSEFIKTIENKASETS